MRGLIEANLAAARQLEGRFDSTRLFLDFSAPYVFRLQQFDLHMHIVAREIENRAQQLTSLDVSAGNNMKEVELLRRGNGREKVISQAQRAGNSQSWSAADRGNSGNCARWRSADISGQKSRAEAPGFGKYESRELALHRKPCGQGFSHRSIRCSTVLSTFGQAAEWGSISS